MLDRPSRIVVTVIAAIRTFTAQFVNWESGRPRRLAAPDAVQPPKRSGRAGRQRPLELADVLRLRKSDEAIPRDDFGLGDPDIAS